jgi:lipopolysaccharide/colanic/teichoic acid biosynthesis glycosyltransferase
MPISSKRCFDLALSGAGLVLSSPLWLSIALAVKLQDGGPVFFSQDRVGYQGRIFRAFKFRSMVTDADRAGGPRQAIHGDPRVTAVGRVLRATAMDELPQLWNIFVGDMSFVGPRPLRPGEIEARGDGQIVCLTDVPGYAERHAVRPGLTGLAQVYASRTLPSARKFRLDRLYVRRATFWLDVRLIARSFAISASGRWEASERGSRRSRAV